MITYAPRRSCHTHAPALQSVRRSLRPLFQQPWRVHPAEHTYIMLVRSSYPMPMHSFIHECNQIRLHSSIPSSIRISLVHNQGLHLPSSHARRWPCGSYVDSLCPSCTSGTTWRRPSYHPTSKPRSNQQPYVRM